MNETKQKQKIKQNKNKKGERRKITNKENNTTINKTNESNKHPKIIVIKAHRGKEIKGEERPGAAREKNEADLGVSGPITFRPPSTSPFEIGALLNPEVRRCGSLCNPRERAGRRGTRKEGRRFREKETSEREGEDGEG